MLFQILLLILKQFLFLSLLLYLLQGIQRHTLLNRFPIHQIDQPVISMESFFHLIMCPQEYCEGIIIFSKPFFCRYDMFITSLFPKTRPSPVPVQISIAIIHHLLAVCPCLFKHPLTLFLCFGSLKQ